MSEFPKYLFLQRIAQPCGVTRQYAHNVVRDYKAGRLIVRTKTQAKIVAAYLRLKRKTEGHA